MTSNKDFTNNLLKYYYKLLESEDIFNKRIDKTIEFLAKHNFKSIQDPNDIFCVYDDLNIFGKEIQEYFSKNESKSHANYNIVMVIGLFSAQEEQESFFPAFLVNIPSFTEKNTPLSLEDKLSYMKFFVTGEIDRHIKEKNINTEVSYNLRLLSCMDKITSDLKQPIELYTKINMNKDNKTTYIQEFKESINSFIQENELHDVVFETEKVFYCVYNKGYNDALIKLYNNTNHENEILKSLFSQANHRLQETKHFGIREEIEMSYAHIGSLDSEFPLKPTQRIALLTALTDLKILPINGGPGTGKTSVLRAMFANYVVSSALEMANIFIKTNNIVFHKAPFVCSSTNNQALINIEEGIQKQFELNAHKKKDNGLYQRWIWFKDKDFIDNTIFYVPNLKTFTTQNNNGEVSLTEVFEKFANAIDSKEFFIKKCEEYYELRYKDYEDNPYMFYTKIVEQLKQKIDNNIAHIEQSREAMKPYINEVNSFENSILYYTENYALAKEHQICFLRSLREDPKVFIRLKRVRKKLRKLQNIKKIRLNTITQYTNTLDKILGNTHSTTTLQRIINAIMRTLRIDKFIAMWRNLLGRLFKRQPQNKEEICNSLRANIATTQDKLIKTQNAIINQKAIIQEIYDTTHLLYLRSILPQWRDSLFDANSVLIQGFIEAKKFLIQNEKFDTRERFDNFYYAIHILEALFFAKHEDDSSNAIGVYTCPKCYKPMKIAIDKKSYQCKECNLTFSLNQKGIQHIDNEALLRKILASQVYYHRDSGKTYYVTINQTEKKGFINITYTQNYANTQNKNHLFYMLFPIFPILCVTCNSFGSIFTPQEKYLDYLLIDEAGTIPPSKAIIVQNTKKVIFFGDTKQLKPVFSLTKYTENKILKHFFTQDNKPLKEHIQIANNFFSCGDYLGDFLPENSVKPTSFDFDQNRFANSEWI